MSCIPKSPPPLTFALNVEAICPNPDPQRPAAMSPVNRRSRCFPARHNIGMWMPESIAISSRNQRMACTGCGDKQRVR